MSDGFLDADAPGALDALRRRAQHQWDDALALLRRWAVLGEWPDSEVMDRARTAAAVLIDIDPALVGQALLGLLSDGSPHVRAVGAVVGSAVAPFDEVADELSAAARSSRDAAFAALQAVSRIQTAAAAEWLLGMLGDPRVDGDDRAHAAQALCLHPCRSDALLEAGLAYLPSSWPDLRVRMVAAMEEPTQRVAEMVAGELDGSDRPMGVLDRLAVGIAEDELPPGVDVSTHARAAEELLDGWALLGGEDDLPFFLALEAALGRVASSEDERRGAVLRDLLERASFDGGCRRSVLDAMAVSRDRTLVEVLDAVAWVDGDLLLQQCAIIAMGQLGGEGALAALLQHLRRPDPDVAAWAITSLAALCAMGPLAERDLLPRLEQGSPAYDRVQEALAERLAALEPQGPGGREVAAALVVAVDRLPSVAPELLDATIEQGRHLVDQRPTGGSLPFRYVDATVRLIERRGGSEAATCLLGVIRDLQRRADAAGPWVVGSLEHAVAALARLGPPALPAMATLARDPTLPVAVIPPLVEGLRAARASQAPRDGTSSGGHERHHGRAARRTTLAPGMLEEGPSASDQGSPGDGDPRGGGSGPERPEDPQGGASKRPRGPRRPGGPGRLPGGPGGSGLGG